MDLNAIPGLGPRRIEILLKAGLGDIPTLLRNIPRTWLDRTNVQKIQDLKEGQNCIVVGKILRSGMVQGRRARLQATLSDGSAEIQMVFFSAAKHWQKKLEVGSQWLAIGKVLSFRGLQLVHPELQPMEDNAEFQGAIAPVYSVTEAMRKSHMEQAFFRKLYAQLFQAPWLHLSSTLPQAIIDHLHLIPELQNLRKLHLPQSMAQVYQAKRQLKIVELLPLCLRKLERRKRMESHGIPREVDLEKLQRAKSFLPFQLTDSQEEAIAQILKGMQANGQLHSLVQGDVGSGKTMVAFAAMVAISNKGVQSALMAPTDILAKQHFQTLSPLFSQLGIACGLLTGNLRSQERNQVLQGLQSGSTQVIIGTHAVFSEDVLYSNLGLVIIDEQHRFGVKQREALLSKGNMPELIVMSATPIPRTLAMTLYGDLETVLIRQKPAGRLPIQTRLVSSEKRLDLQKWILQEVCKGNQAYWIVPLVNDDEESSSYSTESLLEELTTFSNKWTIEYVHGQMDAPERDQILQRFSENQIQVLISTTVVEVGVNVPNANIMVIDGPERFGMAQLHQLRGRVGRGNEQAWCFLNIDAQHASKDRLEAFTKITDGFAIAEMDLVMRGGGNLEGSEQSGTWILKWFDWMEDKPLVEEVLQMANSILEDPKLYTTLVQEWFSLKNPTAADDPSDGIH